MKNLILLFAFILFTTISVHAQRILLSEGFENGPYTSDSIPLKWAKVKVNGPDFCNGSPAADWRVRDSGHAFCGTNTNPGFLTKAYLSKKSISIPWTATAGSIADDWLFTDSVRLATGDSLIFWIQLGTWPDGVSTYYIDSCQVWVTSQQTPGTGTRIATVVSLPAPTNVWQLKKFDLSAYNGQKSYIAFRYYMNVSLDGIMVNIDSVFIGNHSGPPVGGIHHSSNIPTKFDLKQNYPNPFNPTTSISYDVPRNSFVNISIYNSIGQKVTVLVNEQKDAGSYTIRFDGSSLPSGLYIYKMTGNQFAATKKMMLVK